MNVSAIAAAGQSASSLQSAASTSHHKHGGRHSHSISDVDAQGSSVATTPTSTGKVGSKINITA